MPTISQQAIKQGAPVAESDFQQDRFEEFSEHDQLVYSMVVARTWMDDTFKRRLLVEPLEVLREEGMILPEGTRVRLVDPSHDAEELEMTWIASEQVLEVPLPYRPEHYSQDEIAKIADGEVRVISSCCC